MQTLLWSVLTTQRPCGKEWPRLYRLENRFLLLILSLVVLVACKDPAVSTPGEQVKLDVAWKTKVDSGAYFVSLVEGNTLVVPETFGLASINLDTGALNWRSRLQETLQVTGGVYGWGDYLVAPVERETRFLVDAYSCLGYWDKQGTFLGIEQLPYVYNITNSLGGVGARVLIPSLDGYHSYELNPVFGEAKYRMATPGPEVALPRPQDLGSGNSWKAGGRPLVVGDTLVVALSPASNQLSPDLPLHTSEWKTVIPAVILAYDTTTWTERWRIENPWLWPSGGNHRLAFQPLGENVLYADAGGFLLFRPSDGKVLWDTSDQGPTFDSIGASTYWSEGDSIYVTTLSSEGSNDAQPYETSPSVARLSFDPASYPERRSEVLWGYETPGYEQLQSNPVVHNGVLYALGERASLVIDAASGKLYGRDPELVTNSYNAIQSTYKHNDLWIVKTDDHCLTAVKMNLRVGLDGKLYKAERVVSNP